MQKYKSNIITTSGAAVRNVPVTVLKEDGTLASLFLDRDGHVAAPNPLKTGADGTFSFYAANGRYSLRTTVDGVTISDDDVVLLADPVELAQVGPIAEAIALKGKLGGAVTVSGNNVGTGTGLLYRNATDGTGTRTLNVKTLLEATGIALTNAADTVSVAVKPATALVIGGVTPGAGLSVDGSGVLTSAAAVGAWTTASLDAGWSVYLGSHTVRYRKEGDVVRLAGGMRYTSSPISGVVAFTLPVGFRPSVGGFVALSASGGENTLAAIAVNASTGAVIVHATNAIVFLDGITFPTT